MLIASLSELYGSQEDGLAMIDHRPDIQQLLESVGGWQGLFDCFCGEFQNYGQPPQGEELLRKKWQAIETLKVFLECGLDGLIYLFVEDANTESHCYQQEAVPYAIYRYAKHFREAEEYLMRCKHPLFLKFTRSLQQHWKTELLREFAEIPTPLLGELLSQLLLDSSIPTKSP